MSRSERNKEKSKKNKNKTPSPAHLALIPFRENILQVNPSPNFVQRREEDLVSLRKMRDIIPGIKMKIGKGRPPDVEIKRKEETRLRSPDPSSMISQRKEN